MSAREPLGGEPEPIGWQPTRELPWEADAEPEPLRWPALASACGLALLYAVAAALSLALARQPGSVAAVWFANAIVVAFLAFRRPADWLLPLALVALANLLVNRGWEDDWGAAALFVLPNVVEIVIGGALLRQGGLAQSTLRGATPLLSLLLRGALLPSLVGAALGAVAVGALEDRDAALVGLHWAQGSVIGALSVLPLAFLAQRLGRARLVVPLRDRRLPGLAMLALGVALVGMVQVPYPFLYLSIPLLLAAIQLELAATALLTTAVSVTIALTIATGLFVPPPVTARWETAYVYLAYAGSLLPALVLAGAVAELRDSHARLAAREAALRRSNEALEQFVRIASHDLREPLNTVVQFVGLVESDHADALPHAARHYLGLVSRAATRMRTLLDDVLQYARLQGGPVTDPVPVELDAVMAELRASLAARLAERGARLSASPLPVVRGQPALLSLLLQNLVSNALKFVPSERRPEVDVSARVDAHNAWITVADNGIGIAEADLPRLFRPFQRLTLRRQYDGTGLGLALCRQIAHAHDGDIHVASVPGEGSRFTVRLPLAEPAAA